MRSTSPASSRAAASASDASSPAALDLWCATIGGRFELTGEGVVVVRRRDDGGLELRVPAGGPEAAAHLVDVVREQLDELAPDEFRAAWGLP